MTEDGPREVRPTIAFGPFRLLPSQHLLLEGDEQVALGSRAFDILVALVERAGQVVGKEDLIKRVWPDTVVEEVNLRVNVASLRRALRDGESGNRYVATIPGRGYSFVAPVVGRIPLASERPARCRSRGARHPAVFPGGDHRAHRTRRRTLQSAAAAAVRHAGRAWRYRKDDGCDRRCPRAVAFLSGWYDFR